MAGGTPSYRTVVLQDESLRSLQGFTQVPNVVLKHAAISFGAKVAYGVLLSYAWSDDFCFPAQERLAKDLDCSVRQVQRLLNELKDQSFITWKQQGLNKPNIYYLLPMSRWNRPDSSKNPDTTNMSSPDTTDPASPEATDQSPQDATKTSYKEDSTKNTHTVVNRAGNDHRNPIRDRPTAGRGPAKISERALRTTYQLSDDQIGRVYWLVQKQTETLGAAQRNHAHYVQRAAEAVRDGVDNLLDQKLGDFKQASTDIAVGNRPGYFHAMWREALEQRQGATTPQPLPPPEASTRSNGPQAVGDLFRRSEDTAAEDPRARIIADAERRGVRVPDYIKTADLGAVGRWWAGLIDGKSAT